MRDLLATAPHPARRGERTTPSDQTHLIVSPVGPDLDLRAALEDLRVGRYLAARDLLSRIGPNLALRTSRSRFLAAGAGEGGVVKAWLEDEPYSADARIFRLSDPRQRLPYLAERLA
jgi:hypothetical protein